MNVVISGYAQSFRIGAALMILGGILVLLLFETVNPALRDPTAEIAEERSAPILSEVGGRMGA